MFAGVNVSQAAASVQFVFVGQVRRREWRETAWCLRTADCTSPAARQGQSLETFRHYSNCYVHCMTHESALPG